MGRRQTTESVRTTEEAYEEEYEEEEEEEEVSDDEVPTSLPATAHLCPFQASSFGAWMVAADVAALLPLTIGTIGSGQAARVTAEIGFSSTGLLRRSNRVFHREWMLGQCTRRQSPVGSNSAVFRLVSASEAAIYAISRGGPWRTSC
jgi:hypothetical protein